MADLRCGIFTQKERWQHLTRKEVFVHTAKYLQPLYETMIAGEYLAVDAAVIPHQDFVQQIFKLSTGEGLKDLNGHLLAFKVQINDILETEEILQKSIEVLYEITHVKRLISPQDIFLSNDEAIRLDFELLTHKRVSQPWDESVKVINPSNVFMEAGAQVHHCIINAQTGPVYIGKKAIIMEGCNIRGPFAMGEGAVLKMGAKMYGATTIGPYCTAGGEIKNSVISSYSNKAHDGYLGDSVIGAWCNLGAGTTNSNVKNTGGEIELYNYSSKFFIAAGYKCGLIMGDYTRTAINTSVNTGTVTGLCCNVFGSGLTPKFIPDFSWGFNEWNAYKYDYAIRDIQNWKGMKHAALTPGESAVLKHLYNTMITGNTI